MARVYMQRMNSSLRTRIAKSILPRAKVASRSSPYSNRPSAVSINPTRLMQMTSVKSFPYVFSHKRKSSHGMLCNPHRLCIRPPAFSIGKCEIGEPGGIIARGLNSAKPRATGSGGVTLLIATMTCLIVVYYAPYFTKCIQIGML